MSARAISTGPAGTFAYDNRVMRDHAEGVHRTEPRATVRYSCPLNNLTIAGFVPPDPDGSVIEFEMGSRGFLTKPWRIGLHAANP